VNHHDSESPLTKLAFGNESSIQNLVGPNDSISQITPAVSESNLQNIETVNNVSNRVYDITDPGILNLYIGCR
jgi:hypothetical protein